MTRLAGCLMLLSGLTHVAQLGVYPVEGHVLGAASFGAAYFAIGIFLLRAPPSATSSRYPSVFWWGAILPTVGAVLGIYRFVNLHTNPFSAFHVGIDLVVVPICASALIRFRNS